MSEQPLVLAGRYRVEEELGRGGMARVYRGIDTVLGRPVAIKLLAERYADDADFVARFRREAQAAAKLNHPNLVSVFDTGSDGGRHFIVMEYVPGRTLADILAGGGRIEPARAIDVADRVLRALSAAHGLGVIHRDIKPGNIMVTPTGDVKVTDFGIARVVSGSDTLVATTAVLGTASYLSPEQARSEPVDERSDLYAVACVLYEMIAGRPPFTGDSAVAIASKHVIEEPAPPSRFNRDVLPALDAVVLRALSKDPAQRPSSADEMRRELAAAKRGEEPLTPVPASTTAPVEATVGGGRRGARRRDERAAAPAAGGGRGRGVVVGITVIAVMAGVFLLTRSLISPGGAQVVVPSVIDLPVAEATSILEARGFVIATPLERPDPGREPGTVIEQTPAAGSTAPEGATITLTVAVVPEDVAVPSVTGLAEADAIAVLETAGFAVDVASEADAEVPVGFAIRTDPGEGIPAPFGSTVTLVVSLGTGKVLVPDVRCQSFGAASSALRAIGLNPTISSTLVEANPLCPNVNRVAVQDPLPGEEVDAGTTITLYAGAAPSPSPTAEPTVVPSP